MNKAITFAVIILVVLGAILYWAMLPSPEPSFEEIEKVTIATYLGEFSALVFIAENQGYFTDNGLDVTITEFETGLGPVQAVLAGDADFATASEFVLVSNSFNNEDLKTVSLINTASAIELIARKDRGINNPADLRGKKIAIPRKTAAEFFLGNFLIFNDMSIRDVEVIDMGPSDIIEAMSDGTIDATMIWQPNVYQITNRLGDSAITLPATTGQEFLFLMIGDGKKIDTNPLIVRRLLNALLEAEAFISNNPVETQNIISEKTNLEIGYLKSVWQGNDFALSMPQRLLVAMEDEARWVIKNDLVEEKEIPNYLDFLYIDALDSVKYEAVTIIR